MDFDVRLIHDRPRSPVLRFYKWRVPTISLGYLQKPEDLELERCYCDGLEVVIRPTGGRAIYHWQELTYSLYIPPGHELAEKSIMESYRTISECLAEGLRILGADVELAAATRGSLKNPSCFSSHARYEVVWNGRKLIGSAQRRLPQGGFLQQGSILLSSSYLSLTSYLVNKVALEGSITLEEILGFIPNENKLISAIVDGFRKVLKVEFKRGQYL